jgi:TRAP transporter TAXI family solute receptor
MKFNKFESLVCVCLISALATFSSTVFSAPPKPSTIVLGTHDIGTGGYRLLGLVTESLISKYPDIKWRSIPSGVDLARTMMPRTGDTVTTIHTAGSVWLIQEGLSSYSSIEWGPQPIREVFLPEHVGMGFAVKGDSPIKTGKDLKGKTVAIYPGSPYPTLINESILAYFGLTWKDVKQVKMSSPPEGYRAIRDGHIDTAFMNSSSGIAVEMATMPGGIRWIQMPASDKEGWKRVQKVVPVHMPKSRDDGPGMTKAAPAQILTNAYPEIVAYDKSDKASVYWITRALHETRASWETKHASLKKDWTSEKHWSLWEGGITPMHDGAIEYYKEIGQWNDKREKMNQDRIKHQKELRAYWDQVVETAQKEGIKTKAFSEYWQKKYAEKYGKT